MKSTQRKRTVMGNLVEKESNFNALMELQMSLASRQEKLLDWQESLIVRQENVVQAGEEDSMTSVIDTLNRSQAVRNMSVKDYGRMMGTLADGYSVEFLEKTTGLRFVNELKIDKSRDLNESGYDKMTTNGLRIQIKFRQVEGKTLYSRGTYFSTTRRHSDKNKGKASATGHVAYKTSEFDVVFFILAPKDENKRDRSYWNYSCVFVEEILDPNDPRFVRTTIPSDVLKAGREWKERLNAGNK